MARKGLESLKSIQHEPKVNQNFEISTNSKEKEKVSSMRHLTRIFDKASEDPGKVGWRHARENMIKHA